MNNTRFVFDNIDENLNCISIVGSYTGASKNIVSNIDKGDNRIYAQNHGFNQGDWVLFSEPGFDDDYGNSSSYIGQVSKVINYNLDDFTIKDYCSKDYSANNNMWVRKLNPVINVGFENFKIRRINSLEGDGKTFSFHKSINCWVKGVESNNCTGYHIHIAHSSHIYIFGCYLHHATNYDSDEGTGYGVVIGANSTNCLIENNIFKKTRHAMLVSTGANSNVFGYNYSFDSEWDWYYQPFTDPGDIRCHGRYPYGNLFEGNIVNKIYLDGTHGLNGPYNTFLRNWTVGTPPDNDLSITRNILVNKANYSNFISNDIWGGVETLNSSYIYDHCVKDDLGQTYPHSLYHVNRGNPFYEDLSSEISYYYTSNPVFLNGHNWPAIGPKAAGDNSIPALERKNNTIKTCGNFMSHPPQPLSISISSIGNNQYRADVTGGSGNYKDYRWWYRNNGLIRAPNVGEWIHNSSWDDQKTVTYSPSYNWSLKC